MEPLFKKTSDMNPFVMPLIVGSVYVVGTIICLPVISKCHRRVIQMVGSLFISFIIFTCLGPFDLYSLLNHNINTTVEIFMIALACFFIRLCSDLGISFLVVSKMFLQRFCAKATGLDIDWSWLTNTLINFFSNRHSSNQIQIGGFFWCPSFLRTFLFLRLVDSS